MSNIAKIFASRAQGVLQAAARQPQVATRFSSSCKYMWDFRKIKVHAVSGQLHPKLEYQDIKCRFLPRSWYFSSQTLVA